MWILHSLGLRFRMTILALVDTCNADKYWSKVTLALASNSFILRSLGLSGSTL